VRVYVQTVLCHEHGEWSEEFLPVELEGDDVDTLSRATEEKACALVLANYHGTVQYRKIVHMFPTQIAEHDDLVHAGVIE